MAGKSESISMDGWSIRPVTIADSTVIAGHRVRMFQDMGQVPEQHADALRTASEIALRELLEDGSYVGWFAVADDGAVLAGVGAHVKAQLPRVALRGDRVVTSAVPLVVNVYTEPASRGRGMARRLMEVLLDWAQEQGSERVVLHASDAGRKLYQSMGFAATNEMRWTPPRKH